MPCPRRPRVCDHESDHCWCYTDGHQVQLLHSPPLEATSYAIQHQSPVASGEVRHIVATGTCLHPLDNLRDPWYLLRWYSLNRHKQWYRSCNGRLQLHVHSLPLKLWSLYLSRVSWKYRSLDCADFAWRDLINSFPSARSSHCAPSPVMPEFHSRRRFIW